MILILINHDKMITVITREILIMIFIRYDNKGYSTVRVRIIDKNNLTKVYLYG